MVDLQLLGAVELRGGAGERFGLGPQQQRCVLAVLAMSPGRPVAVDTLIGHVWDRHPPENVRDLVYTYASRLRRVLRQAGAPAVLRRASGGYALDLGPEEVDVHRARTLAGRSRQEPEPAVELLREATGLWRGTPLTGLRGDWAARVRAGLVREQITLLTERFDAELELGRHAEVVEELSGAVVEHPSAEPLIAQLMLALYRTGRQADALAAYDTARRHLVEELGEDPGPALRELHERILRHDPGLDGRATSPALRPAPPSAPAVQPAQLPSDVAGFAGRDDDLESLDSSLPDATGTAAVCVIVGTAGLGKTTLAVHWAHRTAKHFPDGQLYVNLRSFDDTSGAAVGPDQALRGFLEAFGLREEQLPSDTDGLSALFRSVLAGRRVLVVLDNAGDVDQIRPLLPAAAGCLALVTSRSELPGLLVTGATRLGLELFTPREARQMLLHRLGADRLDGQSEALEEIIARCAGLPLALAIVAAHAASRPDFPLAALAEQLRGEGGLAAFSGGDIRTDIRAVFSWSYHSLSAAAARLFRMTGLHTGPELSCAAAAHLAGLPLRRTRTLLSELTHAHLLTEPAPDRFTSHDLLHAYAAELARHLDPEPERHAALSRILDYYLHSAHSARLATGIGSHMEPPGPPLPTTTAERFANASQAMDWLTTERRTLTAAVRLAAQTGFDAYAVQVSRWLTIFLDRQGHWHEQAELQDIAVLAAQRLDDPVEQARSLTDLARSHIRTERMEQAQIHLKKAHELFHTSADTRGQARVHHLLAYIHELNEAYDQALHHALRMLDLDRAGGDEDALGRSLNAVGWLHTRLGDHGQALTHLSEALSIQDRIGDQYGMGLTLDSMALTHQNGGNWREAIRHYQRALDLLQSPQAAHRLAAAETLARLGDTHHSAGDPAAARDAWRQARDIYEELQHPKANELRARLDEPSALETPPAGLSR